jgi:hypothetical protein
MTSNIATRNHYRCPCGNTWQDEWNTACDARCLACDTACSPYRSQDLTVPDAVAIRAPQTDTIRRLNDEFRRTLHGGMNLQTLGIVALSPLTQAKIMRAIIQFDAFEESNDPHGEHDFIAVEIDGTRVFAKIDYYAPDMEHGSDDPADPQKTIRVMTIMTAEEY